MLVPITKNDDDVSSPISITMKYLFLILNLGMEKETITYLVGSFFTFLTIPNTILVREVSYAVLQYLNMFTDHEFT